MTKTRTEKACCCPPLRCQELLLRPAMRLPARRREEGLKPVFRDACPAAADTAAGRWPKSRGWSLTICTNVHAFRLRG